MNSDDKINWLKKKKKLLGSALIFLAIGFVFFLLGGLLNSVAIMVISHLLLLIVTPVLCILFIFFSLYNVKYESYILGAISVAFKIFLATLLGGIVLFASIFFLIELLPYIYTPPALTSENLPVFKDCVQLVKDYDQYKNLQLRFGILRSNGEKLNKNKSEEEIDRIKQLSKRLYNVKCTKLEREGDIVLFYKIANSIFQKAPFSPPGNGVAYSLSGKNPNEIDSEPLNQYKPFVKVADSWYMSRRLAFGGPRINMPVSIPKSLIDHSLRIDEIDPNELHKFD